MLVLQDKQSIVLHLKNPQRVLSVIPTAKLTMYQGHHLVVVPHRIDEVKVLRNLGVRAPAPIHYYYRWPGQFTPFDVQRHTAEFVTMHEKLFVLNDLGTGKTMSALWGYDYLKQEGKVKRALVVTPLSTLERVWGDEIFKNFPHLSFSVLYGSAERRRKLLDQEADLYLINHHGIQVVQEQLNKRPDIDLVIVDECAVFRNQRTALWKSLKAVAEKHTRKLWMMTGTPTPNSPEDAYAQVKLVSPTRVPHYFGKWREMVMRDVTMYKRVPRSDATKTVFSAMQPAIRFTRDQCLDLPPCIYQTRHVELTAEQAKAYKEMLTKLRTDIDGEQIQAVNEGVKLGKLVQIACGVGYARDGVEVVIPSQNRIDALIEIIEQAGTKVIVFVPFIGALTYITEQLRKAKIATEMIYGDVKKSDRDRIFGAFQRAEDPRVIVAQPRAMSHGLTLTAASTIVWFAPTTSNEEYEQANGRITRAGQQHTQFIINIEGTQTERRMYERLKNKQRLQGALLELVEYDNDAAI